jgi:FixJ family two-component response regulator
MDQESIMQQQTRKTATALTVVIIERDDAVRKSLEGLISASGRTVLAFDSGLRYLDATVHHHHGRPDCVIVDVHMPDVNGLELYGIITTQNPDVPVIFVTRFPDEAMKEHARSLRLAGYFSAPLNTGALLGCVDKALSSDPQE